MNLFDLRGKLSDKTNLLLQVLGIVLLVLVWHILTMGVMPFVKPSLLPSPWSVLKVYPELITKNDLISNTAKSLSLNMAGYIEAIFIAIPIGFVIGLFPLFKGLFQRPIDAFRYVPLTAVTGLFIVWFGLKTMMKVHFLAFGILIYLLPVVVQRITEVKDVYVKMVYTLGANKWQTIKSVYFPSVLSRLSDDVRVLTAISWTYIIVAESLGNQGGIGALIWRSGLRQGRVDKVFAILLLIIIIGVIQDRLLAYLDHVFFPFKKGVEDNDEKKILILILNYGINVIFWAALALYGLLFFNEIFGFLSNTSLLTDFFGPSVWSMHLIFLLTLVFQLNKIFRK